MFIVWGTRRTERSLGYVADFCSVCRDTRAFQLMRIGLASHLYFISFGAGRFVKHLMRCQECGVDCDTEATRYVNIEKHRPTNLPALVQTTFPNLQTTYAAQIALQAQIEKAPHALAPADRQRLLIEPFEFLHREVEVRFENGTAMDKTAGIAFFTTLLGTIGIVAGAIYLQGTLTDGALMASVAVFCIGGIYTFVQIGLAPGRFLRSRIIPKLARSLDPLRPDESELTKCLSKCREIGWKIGRKIKPRQILDEIHRGHGNLRQAI